MCICTCIDKHLYMHSISLYIYILRAYIVIDFIFIRHMCIQYFLYVYARGTTQPRHCVWPKTSISCVCSLSTQNSRLLTMLP